MENSPDDLLRGEVSKQALFQRLGDLIFAHRKELEEERQRQIDEEFRREILCRALEDTSTSKNDREAYQRHYYLSIALDYLGKSNCLDKQLVSILEDRYGRIISIGWNVCGPNGQNHEEKALKECLRKHSARGEDGGLCRSFHSEEMAAFKVRECGLKLTDYDRFGWHRFETPEESKISRKALRHAFSKTDKKRLRGAKLYLFGAHYVCSLPCQWLLRFLKIQIPTYVDVIGGHRVVFPTTED